MEKLRFSIEIKALREKVWNTLWEDKKFRDWAHIIDEGLYLDGEIKEGNEVQFIPRTGSIPEALLRWDFLPPELTAIA